MGTFRDLHKYYVNCFDDSGKFNKEKAKNIFGGIQHQGDKRLTILERVYAVILNSEFTDNLLKSYITNSNMTLEEAGELYNNTLEENQRLSKSVLNNRLYYISRKVNDIFIDLKINGKNYNIVTWVTDGNMFNDFDDEKKDIANQFTDQIRQFVEKYIDKPESKDAFLLIKIPKYERVSSVDKDRFNEFLEIIHPYSKVVRNKIQEQFENYREEIGYFRHLMSQKAELSDEEKEIKRSILRWLGDYKEELGDSQL